MQVIQPTGSLSCFKGSKILRLNITFEELDAFWIAVYPQRQLSIKGFTSFTDEWKGLTEAAGL